MIDGNFNDETLEALLWLERRPDWMKVCGSRFFGDASRSSDFDIISDDQQLKAEIEERGWAKAKSDELGYLDKNTSAIFQRGSVQVIFVKNMARRLEAREHIQTNGLDRHQTETWDAFYEAHP